MIPSQSWIGLERPFLLSAKRRNHTKKEQVHSIHSCSMGPPLELISFSTSVLFFSYYFVSLVLFLLFLLFLPLTLTLFSDPINSSSLALLLPLLFLFIPPSHPSHQIATYHKKKKPKSNNTTTFSSSSSHPTSYLVLHTHFSSPASNTRHNSRPRY